MKMEFQKFMNFLDTTSDNKDIPRFVTKRWIEIYDQSGENYNVNKEIRIKTSMLRSDLCDFSDAYIVVEETATIAGASNRGRKDRPLAFKNNAPLIGCTSKINGVQTDNAEDLDAVMPMYNLLEYSKNYRKTTDSLWNYYKDELSNVTNNNDNLNRNVINSEFFKYKTSITESTYNVDARATNA